MPPVEVEQRFILSDHRYRYLEYIAQYWRVLVTQHDMTLMSAYLPDYLWADVTLK